MHRSVSLLLLGSCLFAQNAVTDWAAIVQPIINTPAKPLNLQYLLRAIVQVAVYDAANAVNGGYQPFAGNITPQPAADIRAAVATAAYRVTRTLVSGAPSTALDSAYDTYMAGIPDGDAKTRGIQVGQSAAAATEALRADDGRKRWCFFACRSNPQAYGRVRTRWRMRNPARHSEFRPDQAVYLYRSEAVPPARSRLLDVRQLDTGLQRDERLWARRQPAGRR